MEGYARTLGISYAEREHWTFCYRDFKVSVTKESHPSPPLIKKTNFFVFRIAKSAGYKSSELELLQEGNTLCIGGKEIEVILVKRWSLMACICQCLSTVSVLLSVVLLVKLKNTLLIRIINQTFLLIWFFRFMRCSFKHRNISGYCFFFP